MGSCQHSNWNFNTDKCDSCGMDGETLLNTSGVNITLPNCTHGNWESALGMLCPDCNQCMDCYGNVFNLCAYHASYGVQRSTGPVQFNGYTQYMPTVTGTVTKEYRWTTWEDKCECGSDAVGASVHSDYCKKYVRE